MIKTKPSKQYWNYFLSLEEDVEKVARYIEFSDENLNTYSIELARILLSASSEIDVLLKQICSYIDKKNKAKNIDHYKKIITNNLVEFIDEIVFIHRYGFQFQPWEDWKEDVNPKWWTSHTNVKHHRNDHFQEANLENVLKAVGALLVCVTYYYKFKFQEERKERKMQIDMNKTCELLNPKSKLFKFKPSYHQHPIYLY